jgi:dihydroorotase
VDKKVEFGLAANGISGIETALGLVLAAVDAGVVSLRRAIEARTIGPARVLGQTPAFETAQPADLVVFDRSDRWRVAADALLSKGHNTPLMGRELPGRVLVTVMGGRLAWLAE